MSCRDLDGGTGSRQLLAAVLITLGARGLTVPPISLGPAAAAIPLSLASGFLLHTALRLAVVSALCKRGSRLVFRTMSAPANNGIQQTGIDARERLDAWTREMMEWHFNPETGCPFWLERAKSFDFDPRRDVKKYEDLDLFGNFQDEWLRGGPVRRWVPKGLAGKPIYVFETGGSTGVPKSRIASEDFRIDYEMFSDTLPDARSRRARIGSRSDPPARGACDLRSSIWHSIAAASASNWTSIPVG